MYKKIIFQNLILNFVLIFSAQSAETGGMPQLNTEFWISQIFWLIITFGALFIVPVSYTHLTLPTICSV